MKHKESFADKILEFLIRHAVTLSLAIIFSIIAVDETIPTRVLVVLGVGLLLNAIVSFSLQIKVSIIEELKKDNKNEESKEDEVLHE